MWLNCGSGMVQIFVWWKSQTAFFILCCFTLREKDTEVAKYWLLASFRKKSGYWHFLFLPFCEIYTWQKLEIFRIIFVALSLLELWNVSAVHDWHLQIICSMHVLDGVCRTSFESRRGKKDLRYMWIICSMPHAHFKWCLATVCCGLQLPNIVK